VLTLQTLAFLISVRFSSTSRRQVNASEEAGEIPQNGKIKESRCRRYSCVKGRQEADG